MRPIRLRVATGIASLLLVQVGVTFALGDRMWTHATTLFWIVVIAATLCVLASVVLIGLARRNQQAELGLVGAFFAVISTMAVVHGVTTPGVLYQANAATAASVFWAVPAGAFVMTPSLLRRTSFGRRVGRRWFEWAIGTYVAVLGLCATMLVSPDLIPVPDMGSPLAVLGALTWAGMCVGLGWRHVRLAEVAQRTGPLVITFGFTLVASATLVFLKGPAFSPHFWLAHVLDISGVFLATIGGFFVYLKEGSTKRVLAPVLAIDAHAALEVGLSPVVHAFVADLEAKDQMTRDHVVRSGALAIDVAQKLELDAGDIRLAGLAGLLHDVGKLTIPDEILTKPGKLDEHEMEIMRSHAAAGARLLLEAPGLEDIAPHVRSHHERIDGHGYPSGLHEDEIPLIARIISACDAFDAITVSRHYSEGRPVDVAHSILRSNAGTQWDEHVVDVLIHHTSAPGFDIAKPTALDRVGGEVRRGHLGCDCQHQLVS